MENKTFISSLSSWHTLRKAALHFQGLVIDLESWLEVFKHVG